MVFCGGSYYEPRSRGVPGRSGAIRAGAAAAAIGPIRPRGLEGAGAPLGHGCPSNRAEAPCRGAWAPLRAGLARIRGAPGRGDPAEAAGAHPWAPGPEGPDLGAGAAIEKYERAVWVSRLVVSTYP